MMQIAGIFGVAVIIALLEVPPLLKKKHTKELWIFSIMLTIGVSLSIAQSAGVPIPNPLDWMNAGYKLVSQ